MMKKISSFLSLHKAYSAFRDSLQQYKRVRKRLSPGLLATFESHLDNLSNALEEKNKEQASNYAIELAKFTKAHCKKNFLDYSKEFVVAVLVALALAGVVRQTWFELYEIPTGSMRPTFKETDRVWVMKNSFGINTPFQTSHLEFEPKLMKRGAIVVLTGDGLDLPDVDTLYFGLFPGKKRYVKRLCALGGDTIYFYGGRIWGIDKEGHEITDYGNYEHIPFITFEGKIEQGLASDTSKTLYIKHMNIPVGRAKITQDGDFVSQVKTSKGWKKEQVNKTPHDHPEALFEFWGIGNYASTRLVEEKNVPQSVVKANPKAANPEATNPEIRLFLEISHSPTVELSRNIRRIIKPRKTWLPLTQEALVSIKNALYTARFYIHEGKLYRYTQEGPDYSSKGVSLSSPVADGCYEFYHGVAYKIGFGGYAEALDPTHPLYPSDDNALVFWYNHGIDLYPESSFTARYAYFRDGSLYTLDSKIVDKQNPLLERFVEDEKAHAKTSSAYVAFVDHGKPTQDQITHFGLSIPDGYYLLLGDNHAMSNDSRFFGAVPEKNIQGSPALIFWPPGARWGVPPQPSIPFFRTPNMVILAFAFVAIGIGTYTYFQRTSIAFYRKLRSTSSK